MEFKEIVYNTHMKIKKTESKKKEKKSKSEEPWVKVIKLHVQPENPRNGFFELDWNDEFVNMLKQSGIKERHKKKLWIVGFKHCVEQSAMSKDWM